MLLQDSHAGTMWTILRARTILLAANGGAADPRSDAYQRHLRASTQHAQTMSAPFVSYAQNFEDVMLWRALKDVRGGFYVDVGAYSPREQSVTLAFYERGWSGINIEPNPEAFAQLVAGRPRDTNLPVAISDTSGTSTMSLFPATGLSTLDTVVAAERIREGWDFRPQPVRVETLRSVWASHVPLGQQVHFLKVDVEGLERAVLVGNDWDQNRPWIVVVEATRPLTAEQSYLQWDHILTSAGYVFTYGDGLNRFYLAREHADLSGRFKDPPNVFDGFVLSTFVEMQRRALQAEAKLSGVYGSRSWRITRPLRAVVTLNHNVRSDPSQVLRRTTTSVKGGLGRAAIRAMRAVLERPRLRMVAWSILHRVPTVETALRGIFARESGAITELGDDLEHGIGDLSLRERAIYDRLRVRHDVDR